MTLKLELAHLLEYTDWVRSQWHAWFREQGPAALAVDLGPNGDGRVNTVGELVRHIFSAEQRFIDRVKGDPLTGTATVPADDVDTLFGLGRQSRAAMRALLAAFPAERWDVPQPIQLGALSRAVTPRKMIVQTVTHEINHWGQVAVFMRMSGRKPGSRDLVSSPVFDHPDTV